MVKIVSLIGSLEQFDLANILRRLEVFSKTGLLVAKQGEMWVEFYFRQGQLVCVGPMRANVTLIDRLVQANLISAQSLPQVRQIVGSSEVNETRIALALINGGYLNREMLRAWAAHETGQILQAIFSWPMGEIYFEEGCQTPADRLLVALSVSALLETLPAATPPLRPASAGAPSTDDLTYASQKGSLSTPAPLSLLETGPGGQMKGAQPASTPAPGMLSVPPAFRQAGTSRPSGGGLLSAAQLVEQSPSFGQAGAGGNGEGMLSAAQLLEQPPSFNQPATPRGGEGTLSASQLVEDFAFNPASAGGPVNAASLLEDVPPPSFASANPAGIFGAEIDISASTQVSILPPQPVRNPLPPARIDTSFMTPELVLSPVDLSTLRERNPQVQLTPDQWSLFALVDGQTPLQTLCQALKAPAEHVCMVAGELIAIGLVMPLNPTTGTLSELMSPSVQYPMYAPQSIVPVPNAFAAPVETQAQWGNSQNPSSFVGGGWPQGMPNQPSSAYAPVGGYR